MHCPRCGVKINDEEFFCSQCLEQLVTGTQVKTAKLKPVELDPNYAYAGFWKRCNALILDLLILLGGAAVLVSIIGGVILAMSAIGGHSVSFHIIQAFAGGFGVVFAIAVSWIYFTGFESSKYRATLGKQKMGLHVVDKEGQKISLGQANIRYWGKIISMLILFGGFWMIGFTQKKRTLHDLLAGTMVLHQKKPAPVKKSESIPA